jgi:hypothetical protein
LPNRRFTGAAISSAGRTVFFMPNRPTDVSKTDQSVIGISSDPLRFRFEIARVSALYVDSATPQYVTTGGSTLVTVIGRGFGISHQWLEPSSEYGTPPYRMSDLTAGSDQRPDSPIGPYIERLMPSNNSSLAYCRLGTRVSNATILSQQAAVCRVTVEAATSGAGCSDDVIELAVAGRGFAQSDISLVTFDSPVLTGAKPAAHFYSSPSTIVVSATGTWVITKDVSVCRYRAKIPLLATSPLTGATYATGEVSTRDIYVTAVDGTSSGTITCGAAPVLSSPWSAELDVAVDGSTFTGGTVTVRFVGPPVAISTKITTATVVQSAAVVSVPLIQFCIVDLLGSSLSMRLFPTAVFTTVALRSFVADASAAQGVSNALTGVMGVVTDFAAAVSTSANGEETDACAVYSGVTMSRPASGLLTLTVRVRGVANLNVTGYDWSAVVDFTVEAGAIAGISVVRQPSSEFDVTTGKLSQGPQIAGLDIAGNRISAAAYDGMDFGVQVIETLVLKNTPAALLAKLTTNANKNQTVRCTLSGCDFSGLEAIKSQGGFEYHFYLWYVADPSIHFTSTAMTPRCAVGTFLPFGGTECITCLDHSTCTSDGQVVVKAGYWRPTAYSLSVYACSRAESCLGGNGSAACADGYGGPFCGVCPDGYGHDVVGACSECQMGVSVAVFIITLILLFVGLLLFVILVAQNWDDPARNVTQLLLLLNQLQLFVSLSSLSASYPAWYLQIQQWVSLVSNLNVLESAYADCILQSMRSGFYARFIVYAFTPILAVLVGAAAWLVLYLNPHFLRRRRGADLHATMVNARLEGGSKNGKNKSVFDGRNHQSLFSADHDDSDDDGEGDDGGTNDYSNDASLLLAEQSGASGRKRRRTGPLTLTQRLQRRFDRRRWRDNMRENIAVRVIYERLLSDGDPRNPTVPRTSLRFVIMTALQITIFFMFPSTVQYALDLNTCQSVDLGTGESSPEYLIADPTISCLDSTYSTFHILGLFVAFVNIVALPIAYVAVIFVHSRVRHTRKRERHQMFAFWLQGVRPNAWFWPGLIFLRKGLTTAVATFFTPPIDSYVTMWLLALYLPLIYIVRPYLRAKHTALEGTAVSVTVVCLNISFLLHAFPDDTVVANAVAGLIVGLLGCVVGVFMFFSSGRSRYVAMQRLRSFFQPLTSSDDEDDALETARRQRALRSALTHAEGDPDGGWAGGGLLPPDREDGGDDESADARRRSSSATKNGGKKKSGGGLFHSIFGDWDRSGSRSSDAASNLSSSGDAGAGLGLSGNKYQFYRPPPVDANGASRDTEMTTLAIAPSPSPPGRRAGGANGLKIDTAAAVAATDYDDDNAPLLLVPVVSGSSVAGAPLSPASSDGGGPGFGDSLGASGAEQALSASASGRRGRHRGRTALAAEEAERMVAPPRNSQRRHFGDPNAAPSLLRETFDGGALLHGATPTPFVPALGSSVLAVSASGARRRERHNDHSPSSSSPRNFGGGTASRSGQQRRRAGAGRGSNDTTDRDYVYDPAAAARPLLPQTSVAATVVRTANATRPLRVETVHDNGALGAAYFAPPVAAASSLASPSSMADSAVRSPTSAASPTFTNAGNASFALRIDEGSSAGSQQQRPLQQQQGDRFTYVPSAPPANVVPVTAHLSATQRALLLRNPNVRPADLVQPNGPAAMDALNQFLFSSLGLESDNQNGGSLSSRRRRR